MTFPYRVTSTCPEMVKTNGIRAAPRLPSQRHRAHWHLAALRADALLRVGSSRKGRKITSLWGASLCVKYPLVMTNIAMERSTMLLMGKPR